MRTLLQIFWVFFKIDLISFGGVMGVLPFLERMVVAEHHWINHSQFIQAYAVCQFIPGPNMAMAPLIGYWVAGPAGFAAAFIGIYCVPMFLFALVAWIYRRARDPVRIRRVEVSLRPLVFGLLSSSALKYWWMQSAGLVSSPLHSRLIAFALTIAGLWAYRARTIGAISLMLCMATAWCFLHQWLRGL